MIRRILLGEALVLALSAAWSASPARSLYGRIIVYGLGTWWVGAVGTTMLELHVRPLSLAIGALGGVIAAAVCVLVSLRAVARLSPRALLTAQSLDVPRSVMSAGRVEAAWLAVTFGVLGLGLLGLGFLDAVGAGGCVLRRWAALLVSSLLALSAWLRAARTRSIAGRGTWAVARLGFRSTAFRPSRTVLSAALIASAAFIIVSVDAFRREGGELTTDPKSGTGGYTLFAESELPLLHNPNDASGREALESRRPTLRRHRFTRFRVRAGEDASCLNLYRPTNPTIIAPEPGLHRRAIVSPSHHRMAATDGERANPWLLLRGQFDDGAVPVVADATSLQYVLHVAVGDTFSIDTGGDVRSSCVSSARCRTACFRASWSLPRRSSSGCFRNSRASPVPHRRSRRRITEAARAGAGMIEKELQPLGVDATVAAERLASFHRVENTYLSTFQALGGLGLLLGTIGLATVMFRNVLERRRELGLLRAVGYDRAA